MVSARLRAPLHKRNRVGPRVRHPPKLHLLALCALFFTPCAMLRAGVVTIQREAGRTGVRGHRMMNEDVTRELSWVTPIPTALPTSQSTGCKVNKLFSRANRADYGSRALLFCTSPRCFREQSATGMSAPTKPLTANCSSSAKKAVNGRPG